MKKRLVPLSLVLAMTWGLAACAGGSSTPISVTAPTSAADPAASVDAAPTQGEVEGSKTDSTGTNVKAGYTLNIESAMSSTSPSSIVLQNFKRTVEEKTGGDLAVNIYTDLALGGEAGLLEQVTSGTVEGMMQVRVVSWESYNSEVDVALSSFLFTSLDNIRQVWVDEFGQQFREKPLEPTGVTILPVWKSGYRRTANNTRPILALADIAGIEFRTNENNMKVRMYEAVGRSTVIMAFSGVYTGFQSKTIDGQKNPLASIYTSPLQDVQTYLSLTGHMYDTAPLVVNTAWFETLPEEYQTVLFEEVDRAREVDPQENDKSKYLELLKEAGIGINEMGKKASQEAMLGIWEELASQYEDRQYWINPATSFSK